MLTVLFLAGKALEFWDIFCVYDVLCVERLCSSQQARHLCFVFMTYHLSFMIYDCALLSSQDTVNLRLILHLYDFLCFERLSPPQQARHLCFAFMIYSLSSMIYDCALLSRQDTGNLKYILHLYDFLSLGITTTCGRMKSAGGLGSRLGAFFVSNKSNKSSVSTLKLS